VRASFTTLVHGVGFKTAVKILPVVAMAGCAMRDLKASTDFAIAMITNGLVEPNDLEARYDTLIYAAQQANKDLDARYYK
jgi:hypothetical protein